MNNSPYSTLLMGYGGQLRWGFSVLNTPGYFIESTTIGDVVYPRAYAQNAHVVWDVSHRQRHPTPHEWDSMQRELLAR